MELDELEQRLGPFARAKYDDPDARVGAVHKMPGHAGFAYGFTVHTGGRAESWFLRLPPPNVNWRGTADVLRQVTVLNALDGTDVPHCSVRWSGGEGAELEWFGRPYFVVPKLEGDVLRLGPGEWGAELGEERLRTLGREVMAALAGIHRLDWRPLSYLGDPVPFDEDVTRWDTFLERAADPERLDGAREVRARLLETVPADAPIGVFHGDFQTANLFCSGDGHLKAVIDFELTGIGATLNDVGWICTFSDAGAWATDGGERPMFLDPDTLVACYEEAWGEPLPDLRWFRALAAYKFAVITGFNLMLHRRGKRHDPLWETSKFSMTTLIARATELLEP
ncbi:MAG: phosphotransferase family protein [Pseudomonadales bacterium]|jgi:aminoglycoside phosphotransferase (APT) family kinase protein|nr:phosphotransferase family protein [Pseudomonadales bacterium]